MNTAADNPRPFPTLGSVFAPIIQDVSLVLGHPASDFIATGSLIANAGGRGSQSAVSIRIIENGLPIQPHDLARDLLTQACAEARKATQLLADELLAAVGADQFVMNYHAVSCGSATGPRIDTPPTFPDLRAGLSAACWGARSLLWTDLDSASTILDLVPMDGPGSAPGGIAVNVIRRHLDGREHADWGDATERASLCGRSVGANLRAALASLDLEAHRPRFTWRITPPSAHQRMAAMAARFPPLDQP